MQCHNGEGNDRDMNLLGIITRLILKKKKHKQTKTTLWESEELKLGKEVKCSHGDATMAGGFPWRCHGGGWVPMEMSPGRVGSETRTQRNCEGQYGVESGAQVGWRFIY